MRFDILSLFPEAIRPFFQESLAKKGEERGLVEFHFHNIRDFANNKWKKVDDRPFGGGPGMVLMVEPLMRAIRFVRKEGARVVFLSPQGRPFSSKIAREYAQEKQLILVAGHYEGFDQRAIEICASDGKCSDGKCSDGKCSDGKCSDGKCSDGKCEELSVGDFVLTGGEIAAALVADATMRYRPGVIGNPESVAQDSFEEGHVDWAHYTRPVNFEGHQVPPVLLSGDHGKIAAWRKEEALKKTRRVRPDLI